MVYLDSDDVLNKIENWEWITSFSVGGFEYTGFVESDSSKLIIISSQEETIYDIKEKRLIEINAEIDEINHMAICDMFPDEMINIAGEYGGKLSLETKQGEKIQISNYGTHVISGKELHYQKIDFIDMNGNTKTIYDSYPAYICGFSNDGNSFVLAEDGGVHIIRRKGY